jgi:IS5 family transposase
MLADRIDWDYFEKEFSHLYANVGQPGVPIRLTAGCLLLKHLKNLGDETLAKARVENPYTQYFCGMRCFERRFPFDPSDFVHFRERIGERGFEKIFEYGVKAHGVENGTGKADAKRHLSGTTAQENYTAFPADAKLCKKVIGKRNRIAGGEGIKLRRSYRRESKQLLRDSYNGKHPSRVKRAKKAGKRLKTMANTQIRDLKRKMNAAREATYHDKLELYQRAANQQTHGRDKVYSLRKPFTRRIGKGKARKQYEFGNKVGIIVTGNKGRKIITAVKAFIENPYGGHAIEPLLKQMADNGQRLPNEIIYDRGGKGKKGVMGVKILIPDIPNKTYTQYIKKEKRKRFRFRAGIEAVIGHLKSGFRLAQNYLGGEAGIQINAFMSCAAWNLRKLMEVLGEKAVRLFSRFLLRPILPDFLGFLAA